MKRTLKIIFTLMLCTTLTSCIVYRATVGTAKIAVKTVMAII